MGFNWPQGKHVKRTETEGGVRCIDPNGRSNDVSASLSSLCMDGSFETGSIRIGVARRGTASIAIDFTEICVTCSGRSWKALRALGIALFPETYAHAG